MEIAIGTLAILVMILIGFLTFRQNRPGQKLAERNLKTSPAARLAINSTDADQVVWILPWTQHSRIYCTDLEISVENSGGSDLENVFVILQIPSSIYGPDLTRTHKASLRIVKMEHFVDPTGKELTRVTYRFDNIQPRVRVNVGDMVFFHSSSRVEGEVTANSKDGVPVSVRYELVVGHPIEITIVARNTPPVVKKTTLLAFDRDDKIFSRLEQPILETLANFKSEKDWDGTLTARLFWGDNPDLDPADFPLEVRERVARVRTQGAANMMATYHPTLGYLPFLRGQPKKRLRRRLFGRQHPA